LSGTLLIINVLNLTLIPPPLLEVLLYRIQEEHKEELSLQPLPGG
jgi:hypothetical protein